MLSREHSGKRKFSQDKGFPTIKLLDRFGSVARSFFYQKAHSLPMQSDADVALFGAFVLGGQGIQLTFLGTPPG